ncbi:TniB family NTP-binding protein [Leisingera sp. M658]|uniref:TniB family NTP-binding protein n=1 Tax=Leisingera sp. M658 TaxID=2867015 RepID=UPI0021A62C16|nr:TniB family NTP-binding protein [Leisingera sp. M658]UWQ74338.1 TniB family NTP-binding protein [Leisingera sp. M658]
MMNDSTEIHLRLAKLRSRFVKNDRFDRLWQEFDDHLNRRRAALTLGLEEEVRGIAVVGASGSGKSTLVKHVLKTHPGIVQHQAGDNKVEIVRILVPSPATLKGVGSTILRTLGFDPMRSKPSGAIWDQVRCLFQERQTLFLHLDEAQHLFTSKNSNVQMDVVNTLKTFLNTNDWPVGLILSGTPDMMVMLNSDEQLQRRIDIVNLEAVSWNSYATETEVVFRTYAEKAGLEICAKLDLNEFLPRLIHSGSNEFGLTIEMILRGIELALLSGSRTLGAAHFIEAFYRKSGCMLGLNPFAASDYLAIDARAVLGSMQLSRMGRNQ